jgi:cell wall-associated NlpC family hydrolase
MKKFLSHSVWLILALFIFSCSSSKKARTQKIERIILEARSYTGTPYRYGGMNRTGMDCSGLLVRSFESAGESIPRTSREQSKYGKAVGKHELQEGDLVFFSNKKWKRKITHVGLVTEVKGKKSVTFIHASTKLGVVESEFYVDWYQKLFVKARRPKF